jgi:hypothetical protein
MPGPGSDGLGLSVRRSSAAAWVCSHDPMCGWANCGSSAHSPGGPGLVPKGQRFRTLKQERPGTNGKNLSVGARSSPQRAPPLPSVATLLDDRDTPGALSARRVRKFDPAANEHLPKGVDLAHARRLVRLVVSTDARPGVRSTFGPVSLAYEPELKVVFRGRPRAGGSMSVSAAMRCENSILPASWQIRPGGPSLCTYMEGAGRVNGGGRIGCVRERRPEPISARAGAAQEVWLGLSRRLIPRPGQGCLPGALGARRKLSPIVWALVVRT